MLNRIMEVGNKNAKLLNNARLGLEVGFLKTGLVASISIFVTLGFTQAQTNYQRIQSFGSDNSQGVHPMAGLTQTSDGMLYGTTYQGGNGDGGTVFKFNPVGCHFTVLTNLGIGSHPYAPLMEGAGGALLGTTFSGGSGNIGTIFKINKDGSGLSTIHQFNTSIGEGSSPLGNLAQGSNGRIYGATLGGGASNYGTIFTVDQNGGNFATIYSFSGIDGQYPQGGLILGQDGVLYGTANKGGLYSSGTAFSIRTNGNNFHILHHFRGASVGDGALPSATVIQGTNGMLYGTTSGGGNGDYGTVFAMNTDGTAYSILHSFTGADGASPSACLARDSTGLLYGTAAYGGAARAGGVFKLSLNGSGFTVLHVFTGTAGDGSQPFGALSFQADGSVFGGTYFGGSFGNGMLFKLSAATSPVSIIALQRTQAGTLISFKNGCAGQTYAIEASSPPNPWISIGSATGDIDGNFQFLDSSLPVASRFYRSASN